MESSTLSARLPVDVIDAIKKVCKDEGITRSQYVTNLIANQEANKLMMADGGSIQVRSMPVDLQEMLAAAGVTLCGIGSYNLVHKQMEKAVDSNGQPKFSQGEIEVVSLISALAIAMAGYGVLKSLLGEK